MKPFLGCLFGLFCLIPGLSAAQGRFSLSLTGGPVLSYTSARLTLNLPDGNGQVVPQTFDSRSATGGYVAGLSASYAFSPKWSVTSGLWYNQFRTEGVFPFASGSIPSRIITSTLQVPLIGNYRLTTRRLSPYVSAGVLGSFQQPTVYKPEAGSGFGDTKVLFGKKGPVFHPVVGAGVWYRVSRQISLMVQPTLVWSLRPAGTYERFVSYQLNGQAQLMYVF